MMNKKNNKQQDVDEDLLLAPPTFWGRVLGWFKFSPVEVAGDLLDLYANWIFSRKWRYAFTMIPVLLLVFGFGTIVCVGKLVDDKSKVRWYIEEADKQTKIAAEEMARKAETDAGVAGAEKSSPAGSSSNSESKPDQSGDAQSASIGDKRTAIERAEYVDLLFRRVLQLEKSNKQALYYVALQMSRFGKTSAARQIMESLAPVRFSGFDMAHSWLATDMIQRNQQGQPINPEQLKHHLRHCTNRDDVNPLLLVVYAQLLQRDDQISQAEQVLKRAAKFDPSVLLGSIAIYNRNGMVGQARAAADLIYESLKDKFAGEQGDKNIIVSAQGFAQTGRLDQTIDLLKTGVAQRPTSVALRRALSDAYRLKFRQTAAAAQGQVKVNLDLLNFAIVVDPTNIAVQEELSMLSIATSGKNSAVLDSLRVQIAVGGTSFSARLLLAEYAFKTQDFDSAIKQYEVVLAELPNMTLAINNLAMIFTLLETPRLPEALEMIQRAVTIAPDFPEFLDSQGDIFEAAGKTKEAIENYEKALVQGAGRVQTREKLIALLDKQGETDKATQQRELLLKVKALIEEQRQKMEAARNQQATQPTAPPDSNSLTPRPSSPIVEPPAGEEPVKNDAPDQNAPN
jgi:tetratricopeptide (TPR) repeat protein